MWGRGPWEASLPNLDHSAFFKEDFVKLVSTEQNLKFLHNIFSLRVLKSNFLMFRVEDFPLENFRNRTEKAFHSFLFSIIILNSFKT